jgi:deoxycytidylate deaminase
VKANKSWDVGFKGIVKKASLRSNTVKNQVVAGIVERRE